MASAQPRLDCLTQSSDHLTPRELQVLALIADGKTTKEIASALGISFKTTASHRANIMGKLDAHNAALLTRAAIRMGLVVA